MSRANKKASCPMIGIGLSARVLRLLLVLALGFEPGLIPVAVAASSPGKRRDVAAIAAEPRISAATVDAISPRDATSDPAPDGSPRLREAAAGVTAVAGRVLETQGAALAGVVLRLGSLRAETDRDGLFLLEGVAAGEAVLVIDGRHAVVRGEAEATDHGIYEARIRADAGQTTQLPWVSWLPRIDHKHDITLASPSAEDAVARTPAVPGLELRIPKGSVLTGLDGDVVRHVGLTPIPVNRPPFPLPRNVNVPIYFTAQPGGTVISGAKGEWLGAQVVYPNYHNELPKARGLFWRYEPDSQGWSPYGMGTITADGRQVVPDPGTQIYALSGAMFNGDGAIPPPVGPPPGPCPCTDGDPVDLSTGLYVQTQTDLSLGGVTPLAVTRTYRPGDYNSRAFGVGMSLTYSSALHSTDEYQVVDLIMPDGGLVHYTRIINPANPTDNSYVTAHFITVTPGIFYQSHIDWNGTGWNLTRTDGFLMVFGENLPLQYMQDRFGNKITLSYSNGNSGNIVQVTASNGRFLSFSYDSSNRIIQAVDNIGRTVGYTYDSLGRMSTVTDADGGVTTYAWDSSNRVQSITDARGVAVTTNVYDSSDRVLSQTLADGSVYSFSYTPVTSGATGVPIAGGSSSGGSSGASAPAGPPSASSGPPGFVAETDVTDPRGYIRKVTFNAAGYALTDKYATGTPQEADRSFTLDPVSNLAVSVTDPLGRSTGYSYDGNGNVLSVTRLAGTSNATTTSYSYEPVFNQRTSVTDPLGHITTLQRDSLGRLIGVVDPLGNTTQYTYNFLGQVLTATDPLNNVTQSSYGPDSDLSSDTDPLGRLTAYYTDAIGRRLVVTDPLGGETRSVYDPINGVKQVIDANGTTVTTSYTPIGKEAGVTDARGGQIAYTYDARALVANRTDAVGAVDSVTQRDGMGNMLAAIDRKGQAVSMTYDPLNHPLTASYADGSTVSWTWDLAGRLTQVQDSIGGTATRSYDGLDRLISETTPQGTMSYSYDTAGRRLTMQAASQAQVSYSYDNADNLTGITQGSTSLAFGYDAAGRRISATLPDGITAAYTWDAASQLTGITYANGATTLGDLTYGYDLAGRVSARGGSLFQSVLPAAATGATYDLANRLTARTSAGITASPTWDANGNLTNDGVRAYSWDARNRLTGITGVASFVYDAFGRRQMATRSGIATSFLYDGWDVVQEQQGGSPSADLLIGLDIDERFSRSGATFLTDALGSTVALASAGVVQTSYGYDPYGISQITGTASDNSFQFTGRENDGTGLLNYRNRYYNPTQGRFVSEDPIGLSGGDVNVYRYVNNNPVQLKDPSGLFPGSPSPAPPSGPICTPAAAPPPVSCSDGSRACRASGRGFKACTDAFVACGKGIVTIFAPGVWGRG
jgi:RHS repeat-associated protein